MNTVDLPDMNGCRMRIVRLDDRWFVNAWEPQTPYWALGASRVRPVETSTWFSILRACVEAMRDVEQKHKRSVRLKIA